MSIILSLGFGLLTMAVWAYALRPIRETAARAYVYFRGAKHEPEPAYQSGNVRPQMPGNLHKLSTDEQLTLQTKYGIKMIEPTTVYNPKDDEYYG